MKVELTDRAYWLFKVDAFLERFDKANNAWLAERKAKDDAHRDWYEALPRLRKWLASEFRDGRQYEYMSAPNHAGVNEMRQLRKVLLSEEVGAIFIYEKAVERLLREQRQ